VEVVRLLTYVENVHGSISHRIFTWSVGFFSASIFTMSSILHYCIGCVKNVMHDSENICVWNI